MKNYGDITKISGRDVPPVEVIIGGSPCQDLSVAGKQKGLSGERSGLFMEQIRVIKEMRQNEKSNGRSDELIRPRFMVWENVPGAFSTGKGADFQAVLEEVAHVVDENAVIPRPPKGKWANAGAIMGNGWSLAWRVLDAQFWGVPQRRRRIALIADFGGQCAPEILFERESLSGDIEKSGTARERITADTESSIDTASARQGHAVAYSFDSLSSNSMKSSNPHSGCREVEIAKTLDTTYPDPSKNQGGIAILDRVRCTCGIAYNLENNVLPLAFHLTQDPVSGEVSPCLSSGNSKNGQCVCGVVYCIQGNCIDRADTAGCNGKGWTENVSYTLNTIDRPAVCYSIDRAAFNQGENAKFDFEISDKGIAPTLVSRGPLAVCYPKESTEPRFAAAFKSNMSAKTSGSHESSISDYTAIVAAPRYLNSSGEETAGTLDASYYKGAGERDGIEREFVLDLVCWIIRRLTPLECERLQGFPDDWTDIGDYTNGNGKPRKTTDSARYKALGNSIAIPPWTWVLNRLNRYCEEHTMASLFDGIGGFPLIWERLNGKGSCLWSSEIEDFPIAVTELRFGGVENDER